MLLLFKIYVYIFVTNLQTKYQILLYLACFSMLTPGSLLHFTTWMFTWIYNSFFFTGLMYCIWNVPSLPVCIFPSLPPCWLFFGCSWMSMLPTTQEAVCNEIINIAEKSVHYCSTISQPLDSRNKVTSNDHKPSLIISQQPQAQQQGASPDRSQTPRDM